MRTPQRLPAFTPLTPVPITTGNSVAITSVTAISSGGVTMTTTISSSPPAVSAAVAQVSSSSSPRSTGSPINSPTSPNGGKGSLIPRLQMRSPVSSIVIKSPSSAIASTATNHFSEKNRTELRSPLLPISPPSRTALPTHVASSSPCSHAVDSNSLERRLNQIKSNMNSDGAIESIQPANKTLEQNHSFPESAKVRIYVPYMKHSANSSNHGSSTNLSGVSSLSLHNSSAMTTASTNKHGNGNAVSGEELSRIQINVASDLKSKSYLPRIDT